MDYSSQFRLSVPIMRPIMDAIIVGIHNRIIVCIISSGGDYAARIVILVSHSLSGLYYVKKYIRR